MKLIPLYVQRGIINKNDPNNMKNKKLIDKISDGFVRFPSIYIAP
jgi:hypothetical protein